MRIFDTHSHLTSRTTADYEAMAAAGVRTLVEPAFWLGQRRTSIAGFIAYFDVLIGWEPYRASEFGIDYHCTIALNPAEADDPRLVEVLDLLRRYLYRHPVVAVGEIGYDAMTPAEDIAFACHLALATEIGLPALVHTPHRDKLTATRRSVDVIRESGIAPEHVVLDHLDASTIGAVIDTGCWMGFSIDSNTTDNMVRLMHRYGTDRILVSSAADPLATRATADAMLANGFDDEDVDQVFWRNPLAFYGQSGKLRARADAMTEGTVRG